MRSSAATVDDSPGVKINKTSESVDKEREVRALLESRPKSKCRSYRDISAAPAKMAVNDDDCRARVAEVRQEATVSPL